jgi:hypothetical protein
MRRVHAKRLSKGAVNIGLEGTDHIKDLLFTALDIASIMLRPIAISSNRARLYICVIKLITNDDCTPTWAHRGKIRNLYFSI